MNKHPLPTQTRQAYSGKSPSLSSHFRTSRLSALHHRRGKHHFSAKVTYYPGDRLLAFEVPIRPQRMALQIRDSLIGAGATRLEKINGRLHLEILGAEGSGSFLVRLVRRSRSSSYGRLSKRAQFIFRIKGEDLSVIRDLNDVIYAPDKEFFRPEQMVWTFRMAAKCMILLAGHGIEIGTLFHEERVHTLGADHADGRQVRKEVIDIN